MRLSRLAGSFLMLGLVGTYSVATGISDQESIIALRRLYKKFCIKRLKKTITYFSPKCAA